MAFQQTTSKAKDGATTRRASSGSRQESEQSGFGTTRAVDGNHSAGGADSASCTCQVDRIPQKNDSGEDRYSLATKSGKCAAKSKLRRVTVHMVGWSEREQLWLCPQHVCNLAFDADDVNIIELNEAAGLSCSVPVTPVNTTAPGNVVVPASGTSTRSGLSMAVETMEQANTTVRANAAGYGLEGFDAVGRPYGVVAVAERYAQYGTQAATVDRQVGRYVRVWTTAAISSGMNITVVGNRDISWLGIITGASAATSEKQLVYEVMLHGPQRVIDIPVNSATDRTAAVYLQWMEIDANDPTVGVQKWEGCTLGGVHYHNTPEASAKWGCEPEGPVESELAYINAGKVTVPSGAGQVRGVGITGVATSPTQKWSEEADRAQPGVGTQAHVIGTAAEAARVAELVVERGGAMAAVSGVQKAVIGIPRRAISDTIVIGI